MNDISEIRKTKYILLFDGLCNLCDHSVQFVIKRDPSRKFVFSSLQSDISESFLNSQPKSIKYCDSIILITESKVYTKSTAAILTANKLKGIWFLMSMFLIFPRPIRDAIYDAIAKRRYHWFGKLDSCRVATKEEKDLFLS